jgi:hypothetical protein
MIMSVAIGSLLSIALAACGPRTSRPATPAAIAIEARVPAPAELVGCPVRARGFAAGAEATIPPAVRVTMIGLATGYAAVVSQLERLIAWETGRSCPAAAPPAAR